MTSLLHLRRRLFSSSATPSTPPLDIATILATLSSYSNDPHRALDFFHYSNTSHPDALSLTIDILGKHFEFPLALSLLKSHTLSLSSPSLRSLFNRLSAAHLVSDALDIFFNHSNDPLVFYHLIDALCEHRHVPEAYDICLKSVPYPPPFPPDTKIFNLILRGWLKLGWYRRCREFWDEMDDRGVVKDLHSYSIYMDFLVKSGKPWKAVKLYKEIKKKQLFALDVVAYNTVVQAVGLSSGVDFSIRMFREMMECGCTPNVVTYNIIVKLLCKEERFNDAYEFVGKMRRNGCEPNAVTYHCFFRDLHRPQEVLGLFDRMVHSGCVPRMDTYVMLIKKFGRWGFLRPVFKVWKVMEERGCSPDAFAYNALIDALLQKGMVDMARKYDQEMVAKGLSAKPRKELGTQGIPAGSDEDNSSIISF